ncbi:WhiB family transcriptional regulator [Actinomadura barringtoniae]|uniref:Transcriptional regulator WhiB n=1 Tax=Actinomadura barringtoniae TaxID=1427535 RepID=A0A939PG84_9ACTN|nr:WhiB family transcriptional regulator [Actinomadura barringtoniae]
MDWDEAASCRSLDPDLFFPVAGETVYMTQIEAIRQVCAACPAASRCLEWALATGEPDGIWAGTTPGERRRLRAARRNPGPATDPAHSRARKADAA